MGQSSRSSSTLKKTFQTFKSFTPIQRTTSTNRMKCAFALLLVACAVAVANAAPADPKPASAQVVDGTVAETKEKLAPIPHDAPKIIPTKKEVPKNAGDPGKITEKENPADEASKVEAVIAETAAGVPDVKSPAKAVVAVKANPVAMNASEPKALIEVENLIKVIEEDTLLRMREKWKKKRQRRLKRKRRKMRARAKSWIESLIKMMD